MSVEALGHLFDWAHGMACVTCGLDFDEISTLRKRCPTLEFPTAQTETEASRNRRIWDAVRETGGGA